MFHVVNDDFNIPADSILGKDFIENNTCYIDYENMILSIIERLQIPIFKGTNNFTCTIPPRCEVFRIFKLDIKEPMFVDSQETEKRVFIAKGIIDSEYQILRIVNITDEVKYVRKDKVKMEKLQNYYIYSIKSRT